MAETHSHTHETTKAPTGFEPGRRDDLDFAPVDNPHPKTLTREQIDVYNEQGYLKPFDIYNELEVERNRAYFDYILAEMKMHEDGRDSYAINGYHSRCKGIYDMATHPRILDLVEDLIGPNIICWGTHFFAKMPRDPKAVPWHQDASYWPLSPARTVTAWLAIDDADRANSAMMFLSGTHKAGHLQWKQTDKDAVLGQEIENIEQYGEPVYDELKAGQISLHADMLAHGSEPNRSDRRRCGLTIRYCPPEVKNLRASWAANAVICRGEDPYGHWPHHPRPAGEDLSPKNKPKAIGGN
ncbi:MAG: phytanoyl-CoA dioxygenase family protein [Phycisphaeraceae bacterium]